MYRYTTIESPIGPLTLIESDEALAGVWFGDAPPSTSLAMRDDDNPFLRRVGVQLGEYFDGTRYEFDLALNVTGTTFQKRVWRELCSIPYGAIISYIELAARVGNRNAARAVGLANGRNPTSLIVPCHRVIGADGKLVGYGGSLPRKIALVEFGEAVRANGPQPFP